jgi:DNA-binding winged helix-turn-helix (wHTH) protein
VKQDPLTPDAREVAYGPGTGTGTVPHRGSCCGDFRFDSLRRLLFQGMTVTSMPERLASHLTRLLQASGGVVSKETLALSVRRRSGWRRESGTAIYTLPRLLGDRARDH